MPFRYDCRNKQPGNSRNGYYKKTVASSQGDMELMVPRDRNGEYESQSVKKHRTDISYIENEIIFLYSQRTSARDIERTIKDVKASTAALEPIYKAPTEAVLLAPDEHGPAFFIRP